MKKVNCLIIEWPSLQNVDCQTHKTFVRLVFRPREKSATTRISQYLQWKPKKLLMAKVVLILAVFLVSLMLCFGTSKSFAPFPGGCGGWCRSAKRSHTHSIVGTHSICENNAQCLRTMKKLITSTKFRQLKKMVRYRKVLRGRKY